MPSDHNEFVALIPTNIPNRLKELINYVKKDRELQDVLNNWARKTILSNIPPIRRGCERKILKDRLSFQVGAGIVADSVPENEFQETLNKAGAMRHAIERANGK